MSKPCYWNFWNKYDNVEEGRKRALNKELCFFKELGLDVCSVPLHGPRNDDSEVGPVVRCPLCGLVMVVVHHNEENNSWCCMCPECGIFG